MPYRLNTKSQPDLSIWCSDDSIDLIVRLRLRMFRDLADRDIRLTTLVELYERAAMHRSRSADSTDDADAILRDPKTLAEAEA